MDFSNGCCILCFQIIEFKENSHPDLKYYDKDYKQTLYDCGNRLLGVKIESSNTKFSVISCSPFCLTCFQSTEELWQIEERTSKTDNKRELDKYVETFTGKIIQCRLTALSKKLSSAENDINDVDLDDHIPDLPFHQLDDKIESKNKTEIKLEIVKVKEEVDFVEETFALDDFSADWKVSVDDLSTCGIFPTGAKKQCSFVKSINNLPEIKPKSSLPELRVLLERLQFDAKGNILQKMSTNKRLRNKSQVNPAQTPFLVKNSSPGERCRRNKTEQILRYCDDTDEDFECSEKDLNSDYAESKDGGVITQFRNSEHRVKTHLRRRKRSSLKNDKSVKSFKCSVCPSVFSFARELDFHSKKSGHINGLLFKCTKCRHSFYRKIDLALHKPCCNYQSRKCDYCDTICKSNNSYYVHVKSHEEWKIKRHSKKKIKIEFQCAVCSSEFIGIGKFQEHLKKTGHINIPSVQCTKCSRKFYNDSHLNNHDNNVHELYVRICPNCNKEIAGRFKFWHHVILCRKLTEMKEEPKEGKTLALPDNVSNQITNHTNPQKPYKCVQCNASFYRTNSLRRHKANHLIKTNIQCQICFCFYKDQEAFEKHLKRHSKEIIKIECNLCDRNFKEFKHLIAHQITDHGLQSPFLCKHCKMTFSYKSDLMFHLKSIHDEKPSSGSNQSSSCDFCGKTYKHQQTLFFHTFSHTNFSTELIKKHLTKNSAISKGNFQCEECGKILTNSNSFKRHLKQEHSDSREEGNFPCKDCGKMFSFKCAMERHLKRVHAGSTVCDICGNMYASEETLRRHRKRIHEQNKMPRKPTSSKRTSNRELHNDNGISIGEIIQPTVTVQPQLVSAAVLFKKVK